MGSGRGLLLAAVLSAASFFAACAGGSGAPPAETGAAPGPRVLDWSDVPLEIGALLASSGTDSCGVCEREKQADAMTLAEATLRPGTELRPGSGHELRRLDGGEMELVFVSTPAEDATVEPLDASPRLSFRFHTAAEHLVGIDPTDYSDSSLAARVLAASPEEGLELALVMVPFAYGEGPTFLYDSVTNRLQVQCRLVRPD